MFLLFFWCYNRRCNACFGKNDNGNCERTAATTTIIIIIASGGRDANTSDHDLGCDGNGNDDYNHETIYDDSVYHIINLSSLKLKFEKKNNYKNRTTIGLALVYNGNDYDNDNDNNKNSNNNNNKATWIVL